MSSRSTSTQRASKSDVRRTLFRPLNRNPAASAGTAIIGASTTNQAFPDDGEGIIISLEDELPPHHLLFPEDGLGGETDEQHATAELVRHQVDLTKRLPELLRAKVLSLVQDNWMFEAEEEL
ncbi:hypothetical protein RUND412_002461 [Rhizina undulata]